MPIVVASASRSADALINYALDDKTDQQGERYVMASGVGGLLVSVAKQQMRDVRKKWGKNKSGAFVHAYHVIESFAKDELDPDDPDSWLTAQNLGRALAENRFPGRQALIVTQRDGKTGCVHNHIVVNSIETRTGKSLNSSIVMHSRLVEAHERVLEAEGFEQRADLKQAFSDATDRRERGEPSGLRRAHSSQQSELREFQRYIIWETENDIADEFGAVHNPEPFSVMVLRSNIKQALGDPAAVDWETLVEVGHKHAVHIEQRGKKGRGISYGMLRLQPDGTLAEPTASDRRRCSTLGEDFEMNAVEQALTHNSAAQQAQALAAPVVATAAQPIVMTPQPKRAPKAPSWKQQMQTALDQANERGDAIGRSMRAAFLAEKAAEVGLRNSKESPVLPEQSATPPVTGGVSLSGTSDSQKATQGTEARADETGEQTAVSPVPAAAVPADAPEVEDVQLIAEVASELEPAEKIATSRAAETDAEKLRKINNRNGGLGLPSVSADEYAASQALTPKQRKLNQKFPELSDLEGTAKSREQHELGD